MCQLCGRAFPTITLLLHHEHLHQERSVYNCSTCGAEYHTKASLWIHHIGKHGDSFKCDQCGHCFDSPGQ